MTYLWFIFCAFIVCLYVFFYLRYRLAWKYLDGLPTYPQIPLLGHLHRLMGGGRALFKVVNDISEKSERNLFRFLLFMGPCPVLVTYDPEDVKAITNTFLDKPYYYGFARIWLGNGLLLAPVPTWKHNIKKLAGTFSMSIVDGYQDVFNAQAYKLVQRLKEMAGKEPFDIADNYLAYTTLEAICQTALGIPKITECIITTEYFVAFNRILELLIHRGLNLLYHVEWIYKLTPAYRELIKCVGVIHDISEKVIMKRKILRKELKLNRTEDKSESKFKPYIDILMDLSESDTTLTDQQIKAEVDTIILGGQETIATTLFFAVQMIGRHPWIQEKLHKEISGIFKGSLRPINKDDLAVMVYTEAVLKETLRMYPPIPVVLRYADKELALNSFRIPVGTACGINVWGAGRSRKLWGPDALTFRPERWIESELGEGASFLAFSYGRRACIGKKYAMAFMKTILAYCMRELQFQTEDKELELKCDIALRPISGHQVQVKQRQ